MLEDKQSSYKPCITEQLPVEIRPWLVVREPGCKSPAIPGNFQSHTLGGVCVENSVRRKERHNKPHKWCLLSVKIVQQILWLRTHMYDPLQFASVFPPFRDSLQRFLLTTNSMPVQMSYVRVPFIVLLLHSTFFFCAASSCLSRCMKESSNQNKTSVKLYSTSNCHVIWPGGTVTGTLGSQLCYVKGH